MKEQQPGLLPMLTVATGTVFFIPLGGLVSFPAPTPLSGPSRLTRAGFLFHPSTVREYLGSVSPADRPAPLAGSGRPRLPFGTTQGVPVSFECRRPAFSIFAQQKSPLYLELTPTRFFRMVCNDVLLRSHKGSLGTLPRVSIPFSLCMIFSTLK